MRVTWVQPEDVLRHELRQATAEGKRVEDIVERWLAAGGDLNAPYRGASEPPASAELRALAARLIDELDDRPAPDAPHEPDDLASILREAPPSPALPLPAPAERAALLAERVGGGWLGRAVGCLLGKPVEKIPREGIRDILDSTGRWPLSGYFTADGLPEDVAARWPWNRASRTTSLAENINGMPEDDDLNYTMLAMSVLEQQGPDFTTDDIAAAWLSTLPAGRVFTAERAVYRNLLDGVEPVAAARRRNPYREWIGAQIRGDFYGWARPGDPRAAAALAWRDARLSHTRNGVYGAMWVAAMVAAACVCEDMDTVLDAGLSVVPAGSRLAAAVTEARELARGVVGAGEGFESAVDRFAAEYAGLHWVHVLNNAALTALALSAGEDFASAICLVVSGGWDTDSNGATVGSVRGTMAGRSALPERWTAPLRDRLATSMPGFDDISFGELTERTLAVAEWPR
jgi:ADP-ribosylglycohydrolase